MGRFDRVALRAGIAFPVLYLLTVLVSSMMYPGYSHASQYVSELGSSPAPFPALFNIGIVVTGMLAIVSGLGLFKVGAAITSRRLLFASAGFTLAAFGVSLLLGAIFPMPDPGHGAFGLGLAIHLTPFLLAAALWHHSGLRLLNGFLVTIGIVMLGLLAVSMGVGSILTSDNVGIFQRTYALAVFSWVAVAANELLRFTRPSRAKAITLR